MSSRIALSCKLCVACSSKKGASEGCVGSLHYAVSHLHLQIELFLPSRHGFEGLFQFGDLRMLSALSISQQGVTAFLKFSESIGPTKSDSGSPHLALAFTAIQRLSCLRDSLLQTFHLPKHMVGPKNYAGARVGLQ